MMYKFLRPFVFIVLLFQIESGAAQNLLINGSFENYISTCPTNAPNGAFHLQVVDWYATGPDPTHGYPSVDFYCGGSNYGHCAPGPSSPSNGVAYAGFHTRIYNPPYNEAMYQPLASPLIPCKPN